MNYSVYWLLREKKVKRYKMQRIVKSFMRVVTRPHALNLFHWCLYLLQSITLSTLTGTKIFNYIHVVINFKNF